LTDRLDIPDTAFAVKAEYFERPNRELLAVIKQFIQQFGTPHLWWGHTHTRPAKGARVTFLTKYSLPRTHRRREKWAPCPCCSPWHPKYFRYGLIAWFPDEGIIRCVGDKCYKTMDPEGYEIAMKQLNLEIELEKREDFLLTKLPLIPEFERVITNNLPVVEAIDEMLNRVRATLINTFAINLWPQVSTGQLRYIVMRRQVVRNAAGEEEVQSYPDFEEYGWIEGYEALKPQHSRFAPRLRGRVDNLRSLSFGKDTHSKVLTMTETEKKAATKVLSFCHNQLRKICDDAEHARRFFNQVTISTINGWAAKDTCETPVHFALSDEGFHIARAPQENHSLIPWPSSFWNNLQQLEPLTRPQAA
jgi:hypothetical protein